jgi:CelD/BcsL family acetyltransferase involved in cellulose biosynthesis
MVENPQAECGLLERLIAVEAQKHVGGKPSIPILGQYPEVFQALFDTLGPSGWITLGLVEQEQRLVAWRLFFRCGDRLWDYLTAYQHTFSSLSPGNLLICAAIDYGFANGLCEFDFLRGEESYKRRWTSQVRQNYRLLIWNRRWKSRLCASAYLKLRA